MKIVEFNSFDKEHLNLIKSYSNEQINNLVNELSVYKTEDDYNEKKSISNNINTCIIEIDNNNVKNHCIFTGTKDNRLIQLQLGNLSEKNFLLSSIDYAFRYLNAYTITIFTAKESHVLENIGFENLGNDGGTTTYILEKNLEREIGSVRK